LFTERGAFGGWFSKLPNKELGELLYLWELLVVTSVYRKYEDHECLRQMLAGQKGLAFCQMPLFIPEHFSKHAISIGNQGRLLKREGLAGTPEEVEEIFLDAIPTETRAWKKKKKIVLYAHGGLVPIQGAIKDIRLDIKKFLDKECYLVAFIWRTGAFETIANIVKDALAQKYLRPADSFQEDEPEWLQEEIEGLCESPPIREMWLEMKENAELASSLDGSMAIMLGAIKKMLARYPDIELHLIGHSAGGILHAHIIDFASNEMQESNNIKFETCTL
jgi:hypothetical protein